MNDEFPPGRPWFVRQGAKMPRHNSPEWREQTRFDHYLLTMRKSGMTTTQLAELHDVSEHAIWSRSNRARLQLQDKSFRVPARSRTELGGLEEENDQLRAEVARLRAIIEMAARMAGK